jgi:outer membrane receptor protein involved in Fe transport
LPNLAGAFAAYPLVDYYGDGRLYSYVVGNDVQEKQLAGFVDATYELLPGLKVSAGVRYSKIENEFEQNGIGFYLFAASNLRSGGSQKEAPVTPKFGVSYDIDANNMLYATVSKGFRSGGANPGLPATCDADLDRLGLREGPYNADSVWSYEIGSKNVLFDRRLTINSSAFQINWSGIQQSVGLPTCTYPITANLGEALSRGADVQFSADLTDNFTVNGSVAYTNAVYSETIFGVPTGGVSPILAREGVGVGGGARPWQINGGAEYRFLAGGYRSYARVDVNYLSRATVTNATDPQTSSYNPNAIRLPEYATVDLNAGFTADRFSVGVYVRNLMNTTPILGAERYNTPRARRNQEYDYTLRPRTAGINVTYRY